MTQRYIFGYGSLLNPASRKKTLAEREVIDNVWLRDYRRKINAPVDGYLYLNIAPAPGALVTGALMLVEESEMPELEKREPGYVCTDITDLIDASRAIEAPVYTFIAPDILYPELTIPQTYIDVCTAHLSENEKKVWLTETIIENNIIDDRSDPVYEFVV